MRNIGDHTGDVEFIMNFDELDTIKNCLNEVWGGFKLDDFKTQIGADMDTVSHLADLMVDALSEDSPATDSDADDLPIYVRRMMNRK
jgi:hypothetical protein